MSAQSIVERLARHESSRTALCAPEGSDLSYGGLLDQIRYTAEHFKRHNSARIAIAVPNSADCAALFLGILDHGIAAPLNPDYPEAEFENAFRELGVDTLVVRDNDAGPARLAADKLGIQVHHLHSVEDGPAGRFTLSPQHAESSGRVRGERSQTALILATSGTTGKAKTVPLSHANLLASCRNVIATLRLTADDRYLNIMPLFHIHGLMMLCASLVAGSSVYCCPPFMPTRFFRWLEDANASWFSAAPALHRAIIDRAKPNREIIRKHRLRFIRSCSAALPRTLMEDMLETWNTPVIEAYAMTEACHQMTSNPLPPGAIKPESVGIAQGIDVSIMDAGGNLLPAGSVGEVVILGENVIDGYENNVYANQAGFTDGWFRTGDLGMQDEDGYLYLRGRLKEIINRGGEKFSPQEVDAKLLSHPAVLEAVTFAIPHPALGEDVAAAVVLNPGCEADAIEIRTYLASDLAHFKVPRKIVFLDALPKNATGKTQRLTMAASLGLDGN